MAVSLDDALDQLSHPQSTKRRQAAKWLRRLADPEAGPFLLEAFEEELEDPRTWETQYQLAMALGACEYAPAAPALKEAALRELPSAMVYSGLGDALVRVARTGPSDGAPLLWCLGVDRPLLVAGALQACAALRLRVPDLAAGRVFEFVAASEVNRSKTQWFAAAAALDWTHPGVPAFLEECLASHDFQVSLAAQNSLAGKVTRHSPL